MTIWLILLVLVFIMMAIADGVISTLVIKAGGKEIFPWYKKFGYTIPKVVFGLICITTSFYSGKIWPLIFVNILGIAVLIWNLIQYRNQKRCCS